MVLKGLKCKFNRAANSKSEKSINRKSNRIDSESITLVRLRLSNDYPINRLFGFDYDFIFRQNIKCSEWCEKQNKHIQFFTILGGSGT